MSLIIKKRIARKRRHGKIRSRVTGDSKRPRLSVYKSNNAVYAQIIDDGKGVTLLSYNDRKESGKNKSERSHKAGVKLAELALNKKISMVVFDRGGFLFQGRVKAFAEGAKKAGLKF